MITNPIHFMKKYFLLVCILIGVNQLHAQTKWQGKFEQLGSALPTPNSYRTGAGEPGPDYWQNQADYDMELELNDANQSIKGNEKITYTNNSPSTLKYIWLQLDQNLYQKGSNGAKSFSSSMKDTLTVKGAAGSLQLYNFDGGHVIESVTDAAAKNLLYKINGTMMRVELPAPIRKGEKFTFVVKWHFNIVDRMKVGARSGYEFFPEDGNYAYHIAQFFPRVCVFDDIEGWQTKQFLGGSEFALPFGNYSVKLTVPADHLVAATGSLQNADQVLTATERQRFEQAKNTYDKPVIIVTQQEAIAKEKTKSTAKKTWHYKADNVRDFAFASSRKFIWDAMAVKVGDKTPLAMSYYPKEGNPLWEKESTIAVKNTLVHYSKLTVDYPYPVAISVHAPSIGMEYPMICFNYGRPKPDGTYTDRVKYALIGVVIHEVGHNFFPMIVNSDERESTWMDEGLNSYCEYLTEAEYYPGFPYSWGPAESIVPYMKGTRDTKRPIMTSGDQVIESGNEQYAKTATALNILRETVVGKEEFDKAFKEYATRWAFKHPKPADFFRTLEDVSGMDLDWYWRGWFYSTDAVNMSVDKVRWFKYSSQKQTPEKVVKATQGELSNEADVFNQPPKPLTLIETKEQAYGEFRSRIDESAIKAGVEGKNIYEVTFKNKGGIPMPITVEFIYKDGTTEIEKMPAEIWRYNEETFVKTFIKEKEVAKININSKNEIADIDQSDNVYPRVPQESKFDQIKKGKN